MSSNNFLSIYRSTKLGKPGYEVWMEDADTGVYIGKPKTAKTLQEALRKAMTWMNKESVEYGLRYIDLK